MPRMTADLIDRATSRMSPIDDRELDLRGQAIPAIENLGVTQVSFYVERTKALQRLASFFPQRLGHCALMAFCVFLSGRGASSLGTGNRTEARSRTRTSHAPLYY